MNRYLVMGLVVFILTFLPAKTAIMELSYLGDHSKPRGMRNNNPGNIEIGSSAWKGKIPVHQNTDGRFEQFENYVYGVRAMIRLLRDTYIKRDNLRTINQIINKYAPDFENPTPAYVKKIADAVGVGINEPISTDYGTMKKLIQSMSDFENGVRDSIPDPVFHQAWEIS